MQSVPVNMKESSIVLARVITSQQDKTSTELYECGQPLIEPIPCTSRRLSAVIGITNGITNALHELELISPREVKLANESRFW